MNILKIAPVGRKTKKIKSIKMMLFYISIVIILLLICFPFIFMVLSSLKPQVQIMQPEKLFMFMPTLKNYINIFLEYKFLRPIINSLIIAFLSTILSLVIGLPAAYSISRYNQGKLANVIIMVRFIPALSLLLPWFMFFSFLKLTDTYIALILTHMVVAVPFIVWVMMPYFKSIPGDLEDAAVVDGCTVIGMFLKIIIPICVPGIITVFILSFIFSWNNFIFSLILSFVKTRTIPLTIFEFVAYASLDYGALMAASTIIIMPILVISLLTQKYIIKGLAAGAVKG